MTVTLCSTQDVLDRCGTYASSAIILSGLALERYINLAEEVIVSETKLNWVAGYASVNTYVKGELKSCTASHAAKQIIMFDMSGFTSLNEAITMVNVNDDEFQRTLKNLKDSEVNKTIRSVPT